MKFLTLIRHAKSSRDNPRQPDELRPLNPRGLRDAPAMGRYLGTAFRFAPDIMISSPAVRAWTTAKVIAAEIGYPCEFLQRDNALYLASVNDILDVIVAQDVGFNSLMLVGHNPGFTDFANYLVPGLTNNIPTAGVVSVELDTDDWSLFDKPDVTLLLYDFPKNQP